MDLNCIIFSKDRAMQLDALIQSIGKYALPYYAGFMVLRTSSNSEFEKGYELLEDDFRDAGVDPHGYFLPQTNFREDILRKAGRGKGYLSFLVDDDVFYRPVPEFTVAPQTIFALRLGRNCTYCYMADRPQVVPEELWRDPTPLPFNDFDCTFSLDGHVYRTEDILPQLEKVDFGTPNQLEAALCSVIRYRMHWAEHSCLVGIPHNRVGELVTNRCGNGSAEELNQMFLDGWGIDLDAMDFSNVTSVHQEIPFQFRRMK